MLISNPGKQNNQALFPIHETMGPKGPTMAIPMNPARDRVKPILPSKLRAVILGPPELAGDSYGFSSNV
jgi:hypothetical protein